MIAYAVNRYTKEHLRADTIAWQCKYSNDWRIVEADADGWIKHDGGECPLPADARFDAILRDGTQAMDEPPCPTEAMWCHEWGSADIIAYRPIFNDKEQDMSEQEWNGEGLPPVGTECECITQGGFYWPCRVIDRGNDYVVVHFDPNEQNYKVDWTRNGCRPLRTATQRVEDEAVEAMLEVCVPAGHGAEVYRQIYRAIRDGKVPHLGYV